MQKIIALCAVVLTLGTTMLSFDAEAARRLGGGRSVGMQRQAVTQPAPTPAAPHNTAPNTPAQGAPAAGTAAAAAAPAATAATKRGWIGPVAGLAAGLGLAALASHFGFGEALANMLTIALLAMAVLFAIGWFMRRRAQGQQPAYAGAAPFGMQRESTPPLIGSGLAGGTASATPVQAARIPDGFDVAAFERNARDQFVALQSANDARDLERLRDYLTPELFEVVRAEIAARGDAPQKTEVFGLNAQVLEVVEDGEHYVVSVRFTGSVRDEPGAPTEDLDEVWHLVKRRAGFGGWTIAGIQQTPRQG
jgi:predicted lipid-binding transport protein (Tim44 family)